MTPAANTLLPLLIISIGLLAVIMSFQVMDNQKRMISMILAGIIIATGLFHLTTQSYSRFKLNRRMADIQRTRQKDFDEIRQRLQDKAGTQNAPAVPAKKK